MSAMKSTAKFVNLALLIALMLVLNFTSLGLITIPFSPLKITTLHIPVIIGACILGPRYGGVLGFFFGLLSFITHSFVTPIPTSFVFTPLASFGDIHGNFFSLVICFVPRILIGVFAGLLFESLVKRRKNASLSAGAAGVVGSLTNTVLVLGGIALFFGQQYASVKSGALLGIIMTTVVVNGVPEAIFAGILTPVIVRPLLKYAARR